nr:hypothetical protein [Megavirus caiporensis]
MASIGSYVDYKFGYLSKDIKMYEASNLGISIHGITRVFKFQLFLEISVVLNSIDYTLVINFLIKK